MKIKKQLIIACAVALGYYGIATLANYFIYSNGSFINLLLYREDVPAGFSRFLAVTAIIALPAILAYIDKSYLKSDQQSGSAPVTTSQQETQPGVLEMLAHQLKTSLTTIIGFSNILNSRAVSDEMQKNYIEYIFTSSNNLLQTYTNLMDMHRLDNKEIVVKSETCSIYPIFNDAFHKSGEKLLSSQSKIKLSLSVSEACKDLSLSIDRKKLTLIVNNLLDTALYFPAEGNVDFGYLIENEEEIKIFFNGSNGRLTLRNFEEAYDTYKHRAKGIDPFFDLSSLRMMVAKRYIELMDGKLWSVQNEKSGTIFYITLPLLKRRKTTSKETASVESPPDWSGISILVAEDIETNYLLLKELLSPTQARLIWARDGLEALNILQTEGKNIDIALLDIIMPKLDGFEVAARIRKTNPKLPIIGQTAYTLENERDFTKINNFSDYLTKPIWYHELINTLSKYL